MRSAGNFSPEWGYLAPAPSLMRTARIVAVATAIGATAGAAVVLSLIEHPAVESNNAAIAAHAIVTSVQAATPTAPPRANAVVAPASNAPAQTQAALQAAVPAQTPVKAQAVIATQPPAPAINSQSGSDASAANAASAASPASAPQSSPSVTTASTEAPPVTAASPGEAAGDTAVAPPEAPPPEKKTASKHKGSYAGSEKSKAYPSPTFDTVLRHLFTAQRGPSYYPR